MSESVAMPDQLLKAVPVLEILISKGYKAVFVGGCVRDTILGLPIHDVDIATSALPDQVMAAFGDSIPTGLQHGTVTVRHEGELYEVTTFRKESAYEKHRRPAEVLFIADLDGDLQRRDLTINAIAMRPDGELYDPFGGLPDIHAGVIRCVGDADARFQEDALRMLRAIRFAAKFGYAFAYRTWKALRRHHQLLSHIAMERVHAELDRMLAGERPEQAIRMLAASGLLRSTAQPVPVIERLLDACSEHNGIRKLEANIIHMKRLLELDDRWTALTIWSGTPADAIEETLNSLRFAGKRQAAILDAKKLDARMTDANRDCDNDCCLRTSWTDSVISYGAEAAAVWLRISKLNSSSSITLDKLEQLEQWLHAMPAHHLKQLALDGKELTIELGREPGIWLGKLLQRLLLAVGMEELPNERQTLIAQAKIWMAEDNDNDDDEIARAVH